MPSKLIVHQHSPGQCGFFTEAPSNLHDPLQNRRMNPALPGLALRALSAVFGTLSLLGVPITAFYLLIMWMNVRLENTKHVMVVVICCISMLAGLLGSYRLIMYSSVLGLLWFVAAAGTFFIGMECQSWLGAGLID